LQHTQPFSFQFCKRATLLTVFKLHAMVSSSSRKVYVITGASRGLGLGLVTGLLKQPDTVIVAAARNPDKAEPLQKLAKEYGDRLHTVSLDTSKEESVKVRQLLSRCLPGESESRRAYAMCQAK